MYLLPWNVHSVGTACLSVAREVQPCRTSEDPETQPGGGRCEKKAPRHITSRTTLCLSSEFSHTGHFFSLKNQFTYKNSLLWQKRKLKGISVVFWWNTPGASHFQSRLHTQGLQSPVDSGAFVRTMNYVYSSCPQEVRPGKRVFLSATWVFFDLSMFGGQCLAILRQAVQRSPVHTPWSLHLPPNIEIMAKSLWLFLSYSLPQTCHIHSIINVLFFYLFLSY